MKLGTGVRVMSSCLKEGDVGLFIGDNICSKAKKYDRPGNLYLSDKYDNLITMGLGLAFSTDRRVFIFCEDEYFLRNLSGLAHIAVGKNKNVFIILFISGYYNSVGKHPTVFDNLMSFSGILFNMGLIVHNYTQHFDIKKNPTIAIRNIMATTKGPLSIILKTEYVKNNDSFNYSKLKSNINDITYFINSDLPVHEFTEPPVSLDQVMSEE